MDACEKNVETKLWVPRNYMRFGQHKPGTPWNLVKLYDSIYSIGTNYSRATNSHGLACIVQRRNSWKFDEYIQEIYFHILSLSISPGVICNLDKLAQKYHMFHGIECHNHFYWYPESGNMGQDWQIWDTVIDNMHLGELPCINTTDHPWSDPLRPL